MRFPFSYPVPASSQESSGKAGGSPQADSKSGPRPTVPYWHLWTDEQGVSHQRQCTLSQFELKGVGDADPQWNNKQDTNSSTVVFTVQPVGWVGDWHENPAPQWIVVLSGRWWIESMDGTGSSRGRVNSRSAKTRTARRIPAAGKGTSPGRSAMNLQS